MVCIVWNSIQKVQGLYRGFSINGRGKVDIGSTPFIITGKTPSVVYEFYSVTRV